MNEGSSIGETRDENDAQFAAYSGPLGASRQSLTGKCCVDSRSSSSKSNSPDHVVPSKDSCSPSYCVSSSSSPQTDGSVTHSFRHFFRGDYNSGPDSSPDLPSVNTSVPSPIPSSVCAAPEKRKASTAQKRKAPKKKRWTKRSTTARGGKKGRKDSSDSDYVMRCIW